MDVTLLVIGRMKNGPERELAQRYLERAVAQGRSIGLAGFTVLEFPESRALSADTRKAEEAAAISGRMPDGAVLVALDERGRAMSSEEFAGFVGTNRDAGARAVACVIGGPDGLDRQIRQRADLVLNLSRLTWPHQLARVMLAEQLYRATTILSGHPYHRA